ncbi:hypothetical protein [Mycoplasmopsis columbinasalis]|uniref:Uncharacterized protein n=1 Tax=Mycoplasmopsis columbinasalis TaxID=114880 RepID=A0A449B9R1_9BACT|nr:hypothetical protein [Mycoplasmopsis columbinasalis]VEU77906.1 Uncharacterised protein [Mycoplasmopsis columbinasalis]
MPAKTKKTNAFAELKHLSVEQMSQINSHLNTTPSIQDFLFANEILTYLPSNEVSLTFWKTKSKDSTIKQNFVQEHTIIQEYFVALPPLEQNAILSYLHAQQIKPKLTNDPEFANLSADFVTICDNNEALPNFTEYLTSSNLRHFDTLFAQITQNGVKLDHTNKHFWLLKQMFWVQDHFSTNYLYLQILPQTTNSLGFTLCAEWSVIRTFCDSLDSAQLKVCFEHLKTLNPKAHAALSKLYAAQLNIVQAPPKAKKAKPATKPNEHLVDLVEAIVNKLNEANKDATPIPSLSEFFQSNNIHTQNKVLYAQFDTNNRIQTLLSPQQIMNNYLTTLSTEVQSQVKNLLSERLFANFAQPRDEQSEQAKT